jgi:hypothetical protein
MKETVRVFTSTITCICGQENAHIQSGSVTVNDAEILFWFECGHKRRDVYHFHEGVTHCETQYFLNDRDWNFNIGTRSVYRFKESQVSPQTLALLKSDLSLPDKKVSARNG